MNNPNEIATLIQSSVIKYGYLSRKEIIDALHKSGDDIRMVINEMIQAGELSIVANTKSIDGKKPYPRKVFDCVRGQLKDYKHIQFKNYHTLLTLQGKSTRIRNKVEVVALTVPEHMKNVGFVFDIGRN